MSGDYKDKTYGNMQSIFACMNSSKTGNPKDIQRAQGK